MAQCRGCCVQLLIPPIPHTFSHSVLVPHCLQLSKKKGGGVCPKYRIFICFWWFVWFRNLQLRWHGGICKEAGQECKEEEGAFHQEIFQTKKQLATEASTDFCPSSFVLVHVCMFILKNWARCAFSASYMMTFLCTVYMHIYINMYVYIPGGCACSTCQQCHNYHLSRLVMVLHTISSVLCV